jgi:hypothetical protein
MLKIYSKSSSKIGEKERRKFMTQKLTYNAISPSNYFLLCFLSFCSFSFFYFLKSKEKSHNKAALEMNDA